MDQSKQNLLETVSQDKQIDLSNRKIANAETRPLAKVYKWENRSIFVVVWGLVCLTIVCTNGNYRWSEVREQPFGSDFLQEWIGGHLLASGNGTTLYHLENFRNVQHDVTQVGFRWDEDSYYPPVYPPIYYALFQPIASIPYSIAVYAWIFGSMVTFLFAVTLIERIGPHARLGMLFWCVAIFFPPCLATWTMGQKGFVWLCALVFAWRFMQHAAFFRSGMIWGLLMVKPTLCFLLPVFMLWHKEWRFLAGCATSVGLIAISSLYLFPIELWFDYLGVTLGAAEYQNTAGYRSYYSASIWTWLKPFGIYGLAIGAMIFLALIQFGKMMRRENAFSMTWFGQVLLLTCLFSPHFYYYDLVILLLPLRQVFGNNVRQAIIAFAGVWACVAIAEFGGLSWNVPLAPCGVLSAFLVLSCPFQKANALEPEVATFSTELGPLSIR